MYNPNTFYTRISHSLTTYAPHGNAELTFMSIGWIHKRFNMRL